ncbi:MAG: precorrin-2 dehydrogenase/sirohydrochlorin ferrochelatase family protein [Chloroflexota bacterium]
MEELPLAVQLTDQPCLCVGGGSVVARRLPPLLAAGARVTVIAPTLDPALIPLVASGRCTHAARHYRQGDCAGMYLVLAATGLTEVDTVVAAEARTNRSLVCVASAPDLGNCLFMATVRRGALVVAMHTGGSAPAVTGAVRRLIDAQLPENLGKILDDLAEARLELRKRQPDPAKRAACWRAVVESGALDRALTSGTREALDDVRRLLAGEQQSDQTPDT